MIGNLATALAVAKSNFSRYFLFLAASSLRAWITSTSFKPNSSTTSCKNFTRLFKESSNVNFNSGQNIFNGSPGKPAPVPTSIRLTCPVNNSF